MKKLLSFIMSLALVTSVLVLTPTQVSAVSISSFTDVSTYLPEYENPLRYIVEEKEILNGTSTTTFNPSAAITRSEVIVALCRVFNVDLSEHSSKSNPFTDVPSDAYYLDHVKWAYYEGIINGTSETQFSPLVPMQRQGICLVFVRFCDLLEIDLPIVNSKTYRFTDNTSIGSLYKPSVYRMYWAGIISGGDNGNFFPEDSMLRIHFCKLLYNYYDPETPDFATIFIDNVTTTSIKVTWISDHIGSYEIRINNGVWRVVNGSTYTFTGLTAGTGYSIQVRSRMSYPKTYLYSDIDNIYQTTLYKYELIVKSYFDKGYKARYGESNGESKDFIESVMDSVASRYYDMFELHIASHYALSYTSALDTCKGTVNENNIDDWCTCGQKHHALFNTSKDTYPTISDYFTNYAPISNENKRRTTYACWSGHKIISYTNSPTNEKNDYTNRSFSSGTLRHIYMINLLNDTETLPNHNNKTERQVFTKRILMHELNHQIGAPDHYHETIDGTDTGICKNSLENGSGFCSSTICNSTFHTTNRPESCIMNDIWEVICDINSDNIICEGCQDDIREHLEANNKNN